MAKQRGVVQLSGRVDNLCYYQQKRVRGGLVRRVNLAMSERVKSGSEYTRLRTANSFFGACSMIASAILNMIGTRTKFLHYPNRQALFTKGLYNYFTTRSFPINLDSTELTIDSSYYIPSIFEDIVKNKMSTYLPSVPLLLRNVELESTTTFIIPSFELESFCIYNNCLGISFSIVQECYLYGISRAYDTNKFFYPDNGYNVVRQPVNWYKGDGDLTISLSSGRIDDTFIFAFITALPIVQRVGDRAITKLSGASCRMIGIHLVY